jgi:opacity protein-like surface antigen
MRKSVLIMATALAVFGAAPARASAQTFLTPFAGVTFGNDAPTEKFTTGASLTFMGKVAGFEVDFGYTPDFFNQETDFVVIGDSNVVTLMGNLLIGVGDGPIRPYGVVGLGLIRSRVDGGDFFKRVTTNDTGFDVGFGVIGMVSDHVGLRGDVRYFRSFADPSNDNDFDVVLGKFDYWQTTAGISFKF